MTRENDPEFQDNACLINAREKINRIMVEDSRAAIDHILVETAEYCISHIARDLRDSYCQSQKLLMLPAELGGLVRERATVLFVQYSNKVNQNLARLYGLKLSDIMEGTNR